MITESNTNINTNSKYGNAFGNGALKFFCLIKSTGCPDNLLFGRTYVRVAGKNYFEHCHDTDVNGMQECCLPFSVTAYGI